MHMKIRIITGDPDHVEHEINELYDRYQLLSVNTQPHGEGVLITAIMLDRREVPRTPTLIAMPPGQRPV